MKMRKGDESMGGEKDKKKEKSNVEGEANKKKEKRRKYWMKIIYKQEYSK